MSTLRTSSAIISSIFIYCNIDHFHLCVSLIANRVYAVNNYLINIDNISALLIRSVNIFTVIQSLPMRHFKSLLYTSHSSFGLHAWTISLWLSSPFQEHLWWRPLMKTSLSASNWALLTEPTLSAFVYF